MPVVFHRGAVRTGARRVWVAHGNIFRSLLLDAGDYHRAALVRHAVVLGQPALCRAGRLASCRRFGVVIHAPHAWST